MAISTRSAVVKIASSYLGAVKGSTKHHKLVDTFNSIKPHGEVGNYKCSWCAIAWSAWQILAGNTSKNVPLSYNCGRLIEDSKKLGIWVEKDSFVPDPGDGIIYAWSDGSNYKSTDRKTGCDHVGIVEKVSGGYIYVIEGNKGNTSAVGRRKVLINGRYIRGFIHPKYKVVETKKTAKQIANEKAIQAGIAWAKKIAKNSKYSYKKWTDALRTHRCPICHPGSGNGWNCIGFVSAIFHHGMGCNTVTCSNSGLGNNAFFNKMDEQMFQARNGKSFEKVSKKSKGCIVFCYKDKAHKHYVHTAFYIGDGLIADATSSRGIKVRKFSALAKYHKVYYKYTGKGRY